MKRRIVFAILMWLSMSVLFMGQAQAQNAAAFPPCVPAQPVAPATPAPPEGRGPAPERLPRDANVTMIPGVVAAGAKWMKVWQAGGNSADGIIADKDGSALVAQE